MWCGWIVFGIAAVTYLLTIEPTASLWDCGEFIATSYKLEVGHPPGTPFFFLINRLAAMMVGDNPTYVPMAINAMSALESAFTILFLFWSISHLGRKLYFRKKEEELTDGQTWAVMGAAAVGALAYTFSDTFWFSAVEAEVYALSSFFTALVFWLILKWEDVADQPGSNRWLILIAYLMGLSIGAHILNLLTIPALVFIYYFKRFPAQPKKELWKPFGVAVLLTGAFYIITPTVVSIGGWVDRIFVNGFGLGINSGLVFFVLLIMGLLAWGVYKTHLRGKAGLNTILVSTAMVVIGFSSYGIVLIRSGVGTPMNSGDPSNPYSLASFLNREQYGSRPLFYGNTYASPQTDIKSEISYFVGEDGKYKPMEKFLGPKYNPEANVLFPRMYSTESRHIREYKYWAGIEEWNYSDTLSNGQVVSRSIPISGLREVTISDVDQDGRKVQRKINVPTFWSNMRFFFSYQVNNMYWRYFLWNFVGRQSDIQNGGITDGNWRSGIDAIDGIYLGPQDDLPSEMANNKGRNGYYFLPFILGLIGFFYQLRHDGRNFLVVFFLFFMMGLAIILYLNQKPIEPRERDYAYVGSFYAFAMWIGLGVLWVYDLVKKYIFKNEGQGKIAAVLVSVLCLSVPAIMAVENWDDHDRSGRYVARDMGHNYLNGTLPNAIVINYGDNDTFPLWYAQEVDGVRTDVRVMNASYISGDWYVDQMRQRMNESAPIPHSMPRSKYYGDAIGNFPIVEGRYSKPGGWTAREVMDFINSEDPRTKIQGYDFIPTRRIALPVNKEKVLANGLVRPEDAHLIEDTIYINLKQRSALHSGDMVFLDLLASNDWERPIYFTSYSGMMDYDLVHFEWGPGAGPSWSYMQQDGITYRLVPIKSPIRSSFGVGRIDAETLYDNLMNKYSYGNIKDPKVYVDYFIHTTFGATQLRSSFARLAETLTDQGETEKAVAVLDRAMEEMPLEQLRADDMVIAIVAAYYKAGAIEKGNELAKRLAGILIEYIEYFERPEFAEGWKKEAVADDLKTRKRALEDLLFVAWNYKQEELVEMMEPYYD